MKVNETVGSTGILITRSLFCLNHIYVTSAVMIMVLNATFSNISVYATITTTTVPV